MNPTSIPWRLGAIGFGYKDWSGPFYPPSLRSGDYLSFYARHFNAVELDNTFHAMPDRGRVQRWAEATPDEFRFCVKAPRLITHDLPLEQAVEPMEQLFTSLEPMDKKLAAVLLQFPPHFDAAEAGRLETFLTAITGARRPPLAIELRNRTRGSQRTLDLLTAHGCCLMMAEYLSRPRRVLVTGDYLYIRWIGEHGRFAHHAEERIDLNESLTWWNDQLHRAARQVNAIYGFFNNDYTGYAIGACNRFKHLAGLPVLTPEDEQGRLFG